MTSEWPTPPRRGVCNYMIIPHGWRWSVIEQTSTLVIHCPDGATAEDIDAAETAAQRACESGAARMRYELRTHRRTAAFSMPLPWYYAQ